SDLSEEEAPREPISQRRLRLALCTIEESYPQATLQFLFDFMSPRYYPPADTVNHVLREILLNSDSPILAEEAYTLLMKIQLFHPADLSTVQWDWELLSSVMNEKDHKKSQSLTTGPLFLQYVVQTLEDDFQCRVGQQSLQLSIVKAMLSCDRKFTHVRVVCLLQKMLALAVEVDRSPTCSSNKLSEEMFQSFFGSALRRQHIVAIEHYGEPATVLQAARVALRLRLSPQNTAAHVTGPDPALPATCTASLRHHGGYPPSTGGLPQHPQPLLSGIVPL
ncbi:UNVERIFIED_CONTAM: hypothetical protein FKN15_029587, partial [Acipenser sinensis]